MKQFSIDSLKEQKYLFFTGKGGVGKTSLACVAAIAFADDGEKVLLVSTDPASNLQDVFHQDISQHGTPIANVPGLTVANLDPLKAAEEYKESVVAPYRNVLPDSVIANMEEQLSGSCTVEIAAFNQFSEYLANADTARQYAHIIFDTAPTGHTLRLLQLPSAWSSFIKTSKHGASCLGQLSGLESRKDIYKKAMKHLADGKMTKLILVSRPQPVALKEAARSAQELKQLGITHQMLVINGVMTPSACNDELAKDMYAAQQNALADMPEALVSIESVSVPLRAYNIDSVKHIREMLTSNHAVDETAPCAMPKHESMEALIDMLHREGKRVISTMGKGGVGKTSIATLIAMRLKHLGDDVLLTTIDPANHISAQKAEEAGIDVAVIDVNKELEKYKEEVRQKARVAGVTDFSYIEEDLRSPCTQEIAVFRRFADIVEQADNKTVVIDTAPTGHALLLLDSTQSYDRQIAHSEGETPSAVKHLLPRLRDDRQTEVIIVTLPEPTPILEASRLREDLLRAGISQRWWVVNQCLALNPTADPFLASKTANEVRWIAEADHISQGHTVLMPWKKMG